jgi:hypothetical protein
MLGSAGFDVRIPNSVTAFVVNELGLREGDSRHKEDLGTASSETDI